MTVKRRKVQTATGRTHRSTLERGLEILKACRSEFLSRAAICDAIGVRRQAVDQHVEILLDNGFLVELLEERGNALPARLFRVSSLWRQQEEKA